MQNPFEWLRVVRIALSVFLVIVSLMTGGNGVTGIGPRNPFGLLVALVETVTGESTAEPGGGRGADGSIIEFLAEIVDLPVADEVPPGVVGPMPSDGTGPVGGVAGVIGGGVSIGPDGSSTPAPTAQATQSPGAPTPNPVPSAPESPSPVVDVRPTATASPARTPTVPPAVATSTLAPDPAAIRLDEPVLRFLPELRVASEVTGVPLDILTAVARVESNGDPNLIAVGRGRGLTGVSEAELSAQGVPSAEWHDPAANLTAGGRALATRFATTGNWSEALRAYFGSECDATLVCAGEYAYAVDAWAAYYAPTVAVPAASGLSILPPSWTPPAITPYEGQSPRPLPLPPGAIPATATPAATVAPSPSVAPSPTVVPIETATVTPSPSPTPSPTVIPTATAAPPTETPVLVPSDAPVPVSTVPPSPTPIP